jgi:hypothetical protein
MKYEPGNPKTQVRTDQSLSVQLPYEKYNLHF